MAKHLAKCLYCGEQFDVNSEPFFKPRSNRYAHLSCYEEHQANMTQEQKDEEESENNKIKFGRIYGNRRKNRKLFGKNSAQSSRIYDSFVCRL